MEARAILRYARISPRKVSIAVSYTHLELAASGKSEKLRLYGALLSANLYLAQKGMKSITVPNLSLIHI